MKKIYPLAGFLALALVAGGCNQSGTPGGPGATSSNTNRGLSTPKDTFTLSVPTLSTTVKQGETKTVAIGVKRSTGFDEDVALKFDDLPKGVTLDPASHTVKHGDSDAKIAVKAADDAALGDFEITVTGHPTKGGDATNKFKIKVEKK